MAFNGILFTSQLIVNIIMIFLGALFLLWSTKIFKLKDQTYMTALKINLMLFVAVIILSLIGMFHLVLGFIMRILTWILLILGAMYLIKRMYKINWGKAALTWLIWVIFSIIAFLIIALIIGLIWVVPNLPSII